MNRFFKIITNCFGNIYSKPVVMKPVVVKRTTAKTKLRPVIKRATIVKKRFVPIKHVILAPAKLVTFKQMAVVKPIAIVKPCVAPAAKPVVNVVKPQNTQSEKLIPIIYPYDIESDAAKLLSSSFHTKRVCKNGRYKYLPNHLVINYGNRRCPRWADGKLKIL